MGFTKSSSISPRRKMAVGLLVVVAALVVWVVLDRLGNIQPASRPQAAGDKASVAHDPSKTTQRPPVDTHVAAFAEPRHRMVDQHLAGRDITNRHVLDAMRRIPRHAFVPTRVRDLAYSDHPLPIGHEQTISQPYIVALMTQLTNPKSASRALDIGTGSGYQAAVLAELVKQVYSIEIISPLAESARERLRGLGYTNIEVICGDGYRGLPHHAPFDVIVVAAAPDHVPEPLVEQLARGGTMVIPVGRYYQNLLVIKKQNDGTVHQETVAPVAFVPMTGEAEGRRE